jgi:hypothetical protein
MRQNCIFTLTAYHVWEELLSCEIQGPPSSERVVTTYRRVHCHNTNTATWNSSAVRTSSFIGLYRFGIINKIFICLIHCLLTENCPGLRIKPSEINENFIETDGSYINPLKSHVKVLLSPLLPDILMSIGLFGGNQASPTCLNKCNIKMKLGMEHWWIVIEENGSTLRKPRLSTTSSTINLTWTGPVSKSVLRGERPAANRLKHGTALENLY